MLLCCCSCGTVGSLVEWVIDAFRSLARSLFWLRLWQHHQNSDTRKISQWLQSALLLVCLCLLLASWLMQQRIHWLSSLLYFYNLILPPIGCFFLCFTLLLSHSVAGPSLLSVPWKTFFMKSAIRDLTPAASFSLVWFFCFRWGYQVPGKVRLTWHIYPFT